MSLEVNQQLSHVCPPRYEVSVICRDPEFLGFGADQLALGRILSGIQWDVHATIRLHGKHPLRTCRINTTKICGLGSPCLRVAQDDWASFDAGKKSHV